MGDVADDQAVVTEIRMAYAGSADGWAGGPAAVYQRLADALVSTADQPLTGHRSLDLGAGTGVASHALVRAGARPFGVDLAVEMLAHRQAHRPPGVAGDARTLPFRDAAFDSVVAAFSLNHVPALDRALAECRRVLVPGGLLLASTFPSSDDHPAKAAIEAVLEDFGHRRPGWYATLKARSTELTGDPDAFTRAARAAGFGDVRVDHLEVDAGLDQPDRVVDWRLNMPHTIGFVAALDPATRTTLRTRAVAALRDELPPSVRMLRLWARA